MTSKIGVKNVEVMLAAIAIFLEKRQEMLSPK